MNLSGKIVLITGGSGLLGRAILRDLLKRDAIPVNLDITKDDVGVKYIHCDVMEEKSISNAIQSVIDEYGVIDGLVNNAYPRTADWGEDFESIKPESWRKNVDWQLNSCFICCQQVIQHMLKQECGSIVNIASIYGIVGNDFSIYKGTSIIPPAAYSAIKGGVINFTRYLASKYGKDGIRANCVSPGGIFNHQDKIFVENYNSKVPLSRMGSPEDISPSVSFLLSDESGYITGHNLVVDGGWTAI
ncbi:MAG: SDR family oxidoreductase [Saprospirales bacterium]|nr:MAG: SDR family oxidoreductase [Saprospirales bacterium]